MKIQSAVIILVLASCPSPKNHELDTTCQIKYEYKSNTTTDAANADARVCTAREVYEDEKFYIVTRRYDSGARYFELSSNKETKLDHLKYYYTNGQLKEEGVMTSSSHINVGIWKHYDQNGELDSLVDHDKTYPISYFNALQIVEKNGFKPPNIEVQLKQDQSSLFWEFTKCTSNENQNGTIADILFIDAKSGKISKPSHQVMRID